MKQENESTITIQGHSISPGQAAARICLYSHKNYLNASRRIRRQNLIPEDELKRYDEALAYCAKEISAVRDRVAKEIGESEAAVFDAQMAMLNDPTMIKEIKEFVNKNHLTFEDAVEKVFQRYEDMFANIDDAYLKERATDIGEVKRRLLNFGYETEPGFVCSGHRACGKGYKSIIVAEELTADMIMGIDLSRVYGIVTEKGGVNGHAAILARASGIPAITGVKNAMDVARCGNTVYIDGAEGVVQFNPCKELVEEFSRIQEIKEITIEESLTGVDVLANCSDVASAKKARDFGADGIGLFRTEMLFMHEEKLLSEQEQIDAYTEVCKIIEGKPVTFRLLDIGGDKALPFLGIEQEENPFLGFRGARFLLGKRDILRTQLRALLRTAMTYPLRIMLPMIVDLNQLRALQDEIKVCANLLDFDLRGVEIGVMFEVPSAIFQAEALLSEVDFGSIGSNDLMQYLFAVDRNNELVADDFDKNHPILWKCIKILVDSAEKTGKKLSICGEIASYPDYAERLFHLGVHSLSVSPQLIANVRSVLNEAVRQRDE